MNRQIQDYSKRNIMLIYIHTFLSTFILYYICDTLFYIERGLSSSQYISFVGIAFLVKFIFEIPFGVMADKYNKKRLLLISNFLFIIATIIFIISNNYFTFLIAIVVKATSDSLSSGITNSILYENLKDKTIFNKILFFNSLFYCISYMAAMILGGYIAQRFSLVTTYYITIIPFIFDFFALLMLKVKNKHNNFKNKNDNILILKNGVDELKNNFHLSKLIFKSAILFSGIKLLEESHPEYSSNIGISVFIIGIYTAMILVFCIVGSYIGSKINKSKYNMILNINPIIVGVCILLTGLLNNYIGILFILLIYIFSESFDNIMISELHNNISSKSRVTIESINQFILGIFGFIFSLLMSFLLKFMNISDMYIVIGIIIIIFESVFIFKSKKRKRKTINKL